MITSATFIYTANFPSLSPAQIDASCLAVDAMWSGIDSLWQKLPQTKRDAKIAMLQNLMVAWYMTDIYPAQVTGIVSNGGLPLQSKAIGGEGGVSVTMRALGEQDALVPLSSNTFGVQALQMIMSVPERFTIYG